MIPWAIIGWCIVTVIALAILRAVVKQGSHLLSHLLSRHVEPKPLQIWGYSEAGKATFLTIEKIADNGRIMWTTKMFKNQLSTSVSSSDSPDEWKARVRGRRMYLAAERSPYWKD